MKGRVIKSRKTKNLLNQLKPGDIVLVDHRDMDEAICEGLLAANVKAILNMDTIVTGDYPNYGPLALARKGILLMEDLTAGVWERLEGGETIEIKGEAVLLDGRITGKGRILDCSEILGRCEAGKRNLKERLAEFLDNTLVWARREKDVFLDLQVPDIKTPILGRPVLIVVRGPGYIDDLLAVLPYIKGEKPVIMAVDGGADGCFQLGIRPAVIIGDMDSASDTALQQVEERIVHAYPDGRAPGAARLEGLGLSYTVFAAPGTSEDIAMLLAYEKGADLIVAVGTHNTLIDFLDKGRAGMASTLLVRLKIGTRLVDARGVNRLYKREGSGKNAILLILAALFPIIVAFFLSPVLRPFLNLFILRVRLLLGF